jgi:RNA polymerase sigma factor (sigma-70 family)
MTAVGSSNAELVAAVHSAAAGDPRGWANLTDRFQGMIIAIARSCRLNDADSADVYQTTWLRLVETIDRFERPERIGSWLATTSRDESLRLLRAKSALTSPSESTAHQPVVLHSSARASS